MIRLLSRVPALCRSVLLMPDDAADPYAFRIELPGFGSATSRVVFGTKAPHDVTALHLELGVLSMTRQPDATNPRRWFTGGLTLAGAVAAGAVVRRWSGSPS